MVQEKFAFKGAANRLTAGDISYNPAIEKPELIVFLHGYKGFKDWGCWNLMAEYFAAKGYAFLKFNFSHNGGTVGDYFDFPDLEAFSKNRYSYELEDVKQLLNHIKSNSQFKRFDLDNIHLVGHSRGGGIAILAAGHWNDFKSISTLAAVSDYKKRFPANIESWEKEGKIFVKNGRTGQDMPHDFEFYKDFIQNNEDLEIKKWAKKVTVPGLVFHAKDDQAVAFNESKNINDWISKVELVEAKGGHTFNSKHPWKENKMPDELWQICRELKRFYRKM